MYRYLSFLLFVSYCFSQIDKNLDIETGWYDNGQRWIKGNHKNGQRYGEWIFYKESGKVYDIKNY